MHTSFLLLLSIGVLGVLPHIPAPVSSERAAFGQEGVVVDDVGRQHDQQGRSGRQQQSLDSNKTPKTLAQKWLATNGIVRSDVCEECKTIIKRMAAIANDPQKIEELKLLLSVLCKETSYESECKLFVSRLDIFIDKLRPYLNDPEHVCKEFRMCKNANIDRRRAMAQFYASMVYPRNSVQAVKDVICDECEFAAHELDTLVQSKKFQQDAHDWVRKKICERIGKYSASCNTLLDEFFPEFFIELHYVLQDNHQFCVDLEMCDPQQLLQLSRARPVPNAFARVAGGNGGGGGGTPRSSSSSESAEEGNAPSYRRRSKLFSAASDIFKK